MKNYLIIWDNGAEKSYFRCAAEDVNDALIKFGRAYPGNGRMYDEFYEEVELA